MANLPLPKAVSLEPPGPYILATAEKSHGLAIPPTGLPQQLRFVLSKGTELQLPISDGALKRLYDQLKAHFEGDEAARA
jgi:hypothetical protein